MASKTPRHSIALLLPLLVLVATVTANRPPASSSVFRRGTEKHQNDYAVSPGAPGPGQESYDEGMLQQVARGVFPAPLWAAMAGWSPDPQAAPGSTNKYTHQQVRHNFQRRKAAVSQTAIKDAASYPRH